MDPEYQITDHASVGTDAESADGEGENTVEQINMLL